VQEVTVYLRHRREPMKFLARRFDAQLDLRSRGAQELSYEAPDGRTVRAYLDPREVVAMVPTHLVEKEPPPARTELEVAEERRREIERARKEGFERGRQQAQLDAYTEEFERQERLREENRRKKRASQTPELDGQIVRVLLNFREAGMDELRGRYPIFRHFEKLDRLTPEIVEFFVSEAGATERLDAMESEGLIQRSEISTPGYRKVARYTATDKGAVYVGAKRPVGKRPYVAQSEDYYARMLAFCQGIMEDLHGEATWVTQQELKDAKIRTSLEERLGRKLPEVTPAPKGYLDTPEAVLVSQKHDLVAAIGLELRQISDRRMEIYNDILETFAGDPRLDRAYLFFADRYFMQRVGELARGHRKDDFFVLTEYREDRAPSLSLA
jgi:DNA-binding PadR family transcriptional regulator